MGYGVYTLPRMRIWEPTIGTKPNLKQRPSYDLDLGVSQTVHFSTGNPAPPSMQKGRRPLTAHAPAAPATSPPEINIGLNPLVLLNSIPLNAPATTLFTLSCFPLQCPIVELIPLYTMAMIPAELPRNGPRRVTLFSTLFRRSFGGALAGMRFKPSIRPHVPPTVRAVRYVTPVP
jgi:hypothetical protein